MSRLLPHPVLWLVLWVMWMMLTRFSLGHAILGATIAVVAGRAMAALQPQSVPMRGWRVLPRLLWTVFLDVIRSNAAVTRLILTEGRSGRCAAFLEIPLALKSQSGLAALAVILTATPGTAWVEYRSEDGVLMLHVFDARETEQYRHVISSVYEPMLQELFE